MIEAGYAQTMARYNAWQNHAVFQAAAQLDGSELQRDRGAFWGGIEGTLSHALWGDMIWIARFDGRQAPAADLKGSGTAYDWDKMMSLRPQMDARIAAWAWSAGPEDFAGDLTWYSGAAGAEKTMPRALCIMQMFNHQTHHRGQVHVMLTAAGVRTADTDLPFMPLEVPEWQ